MIGILGASGAVGRKLTALLVGEHLRLGSRNSGVSVDATSEDSLRRFMRGCDSVVNCAGPSCLLSKGIVKIAAEENVPLVDVAGDAPLHSFAKELEPQVPVILAAGMLPGLSGILLRRLTELSPLAKDETVAFSGGAQVVTGAAAADLVASVSTQEGYGLGGCALRDGVVVQAQNLARAAPSVFPSGSQGYPYLTEEARILASELQVRNLEWNSVFVGDAVRSVVTHLHGMDSEEAAIKLQMASQADMASRTEFYAIVISGPDTALVMRVQDGYGLTAQIAAFAVNAFGNGAVPGGVHYACDVLGVEGTIERVLSGGFANISAGPAESLFDVEEGVL